MSDKITLRDAFGQPFEVPAEEGPGGTLIPLQKVQVSGSKPLLYAGDSGAVGLFGGVRTLEASSDGPWQDGNSHHAFAGLRAGPNGRLYCIYRSATKHNIELGATLQLTTSEDGGLTWSQPTVWRASDPSLDPRDVQLYWDGQLGKFYIGWAEDYGDGTAVVRIIRCTDPADPATFEEMEVPQPWDRTRLGGGFIRVGYYLYAPIYGRDIEDAGNSSGVIEGTDDGSFVLKGIATTSGGEAALYTIPAPYQPRPLFVLLVRDNNDGVAQCFFSNDRCATFTPATISLPHRTLSGGPRVEDFGDFYALVARHDIGTPRIYVAFSRDGLSWTTPVDLAQSYNGYASFAALPNGRRLALITVEDKSGNYGRLVLMDVQRPPSALSKMRVTRQLALDGGSVGTGQKYYPGPLATTHATDFYAASKSCFADVRNLENISVIVRNDRDKQCKVTVYAAVRPGNANTETLHVPLLQSETVAASTTARFGVSKIPELGHGVAYLVVGVTFDEAPTTGNLIINLEGNLKS